MAILGPDISSYQGYPNMGAVAGGDNTFIIIKATEGTGYVNPAFAATRDAAHAAGLIVGAYHFADIGDPHAEAAFFLRVVGGLRDNEFLVLDFERPAADPPGWCGAWLDDVRAATGLSPFIYMNQSACRGSNWTGIANAGYPLWIAIYDGDPWTFQPQPYWGVPPLKQYTDASQIAGIAGNVDRNSFNGTREQLLAYCKGGSGPSPLNGVQEDDMLLLECTPPDPERPAVIIGGGWWRILTPGLFYDVAADMAGKRLTYNAAQYDAAMAIVLQGQFQEGGEAKLGDLHAKLITDTFDLSGRPSKGATDAVGHVLNVEALVAKLAGGGVDPAVIAKTVTDAVNKALANIHVSTGNG